MQMIVTLYLHVKLQLYSRLLADANTT